MKVLLSKMTSISNLDGVYEPRGLVNSGKAGLGDAGGCPTSSLQEIKQL